MSYYGIASRVVTDIGTFGNFLDLEKYMLEECYGIVEVREIHVFGFPDFNELAGTYTLEEITQVIDSKVSN